VYHALPGCGSRAARFLDRQERGLRCPKIGRFLTEAPDFGDSERDAVNADVGHRPIPLQFSRLTGHCAIGQTGGFFPQSG
jgi:hypothetical protein